MRRLSPLLIDLYELTMAQAYLDHGPHEPATFDLFVRSLPPERGYLVAAGLGTLLDQLERFAFSADDLAHLAADGRFDDRLLARLERLRFTGDVDAVPEGTPVFADEPILRITAPVVEAQLLETVVMNLVHVQTLFASKAARIVDAAAGRSVIDFGLRRAHGPDAGWMGARAFWIAGLDGTSNVLAGRELGIPIAGTMAHAFVQAHENEAAAFRAFAATWPDTILLVDTYDTLRGIDRVVDLARELGADFRVRGIRLDSGDLGELAHEARRRLDAAGLEDVTIFASGNLDEHAIATLVARGAPIDGFGVGTRLTTSQDDPNLDIVYKLAQLGDRPLLKLSTGKATLPGVKQVWRRRDDDGRLAGDVIGLAHEQLEGEPLLVPVMRAGRRLDAGREPLADARERAGRCLAELPDGVRRLGPDRDDHPVEVSDRLEELRGRITASLEASG